MTTGEVADDAARFTNQQLACGEVPRAQTDFKETVNTTRSDVSQIQRRTSRYLSLFVSKAAPKLLWYTILCVTNCSPPLAVRAHS